MTDAPTKSPKGGKGKNARATNIEERLAALETRVTESDPRERLVALETRVADTDPREALARMEAQLAEMTAALLEIKQSVPRLVARTPTPLDHKEVRALVDANAHTKFRCLNGVRDLSLRAGDVFDPAAQFRTLSDFVSRVKGGTLRVARAA